MSWRPDPEIDELFPDPRDRRLAQALRTVHAPEVTADPAFRSQLRRQLMEQAWERSEPKLGWWRRLWSPPRVAWGMATVGALLIAIVVYSTSTGTGDRTVLIHANVDLTQPVAAVQPVVLTFSQPMNRQSVESAIQVQPATSVQYQWTSNSQVRIIPVSGAFAPNTQYTVSLKQNVAQTQQGHEVPAATTAVFTVAPTPTPTPAPTPSATPMPALQVSVLGAAGDLKPLWNYQGKVAAVSPSGALELFSIDGGSPEVLVPSGVTAFALSPDNGRQEIAYVQGGRAFVYAGRPSPASAPGAGVIAVGFSPAAVWYATANVVADNHGDQFKLQAPATAAWFSPSGAQLVYQSADKDLHLVDLASGKETAWAAGAYSFLAWSPDATHVLYATSEGAYVASPDGQSPARLGALTQVTAADWPASGPLLVEAAGQLHEIAVDGSNDRVLGAAQASGIAVSATGAVAMVGDGKLSLAHPQGGLASLSVESAAPVVGAFEKARMEGDQAAASAVLASNARTVAPPASGIHRWFTVAALAAPDGVHETVRVVLGERSGKDTSQLDESLLVVAGQGGRPVIASVADSEPRPYGKGPEVLAVNVSPSRIAVDFDSELTAASVAGAIRLTDGPGRPVEATTSVSGRSVTITPAAPLAGGTYRLAVTTSLLDADGRPAVAEFDLDVPVVGPTA